MPFSETTNQELAKPLDGAKIKTREQSGQKLSYIEGHTVIREANRVFGFDGWDRETADLRIVQEQEDAKGKWRVSYTCRVRLTVAGVMRDGIGAGQGIDADLGRAHESAIKEAETDAMKRAMMTFGDPFGLALYDKKQEHVDKGGAGQNAPAKATAEAVADGEPWLRSIGMGPFIAPFKEDCKARGIDWEATAKEARAANVINPPQMSDFMATKNPVAA